MTTNDADLISLGKALASNSRLELLRLIQARGAPAMPDLISATRLAASTVSDHLRVLIEARLVEADRDGFIVRYGLNPTGLESLRTRLDDLRPPVPSYLTRAPERQAPRQPEHIETQEREAPASPAEPRPRNADVLPPDRAPLMKLVGGRAPRFARHRRREHHATPASPWTRPPPHEVCWSPKEGQEGCASGARNGNVRRRRPHGHEDPRAV